MPTRPIILAGLQAAGLFVAGLLVPLLGQIAVVFVPVPLTAVCVLHGRKAGVLAAGLATILAAGAGGGHPVTVLVFLSLVLMSLGLAEGILRNMRSESAVLIASLLPLLPLALFLVPLLLSAGKDPVLFVEEHLRRSLIETQQLYEKMGLAEVARTVAEVAETLVHYLARLIPGIIVVTTVMQAATCYGMARALVLKRQPASPLAAQPSLASWHAPDTWVWGLIVTLGLVALPGEAALFAGLNLAFLFLLVYTVQGIAVVEFFLRKAGIPALWRSILHAVILTLPTVVAVIAAGVVDIWADFRKVRLPAREP